MRTDVDTSEENERRSKGSAESFFVIPARAHGYPEKMNYLPSFLQRHTAVRRNLSLRGGSLLGTKINSRLRGNGE